MTRRTFILALIIIVGIIDVAIIAGAVSAFLEMNEAIQQADKAYQDAIHNYDHARQIIVEKYGE